MVDAYNSDPLTKSVPINESIKLPFLAVQDASDIGDQIGAGNIRIFARDHGGNDKEGLDALSGDFTGGTSFSSAMGFVVEAGNQSDDNTLNFTAKVTSTNNPFDRVIFYADVDGDDDGMDRRLIATVEEYDARQSSGEWSYRARVSADDFYSAVDGDGNYEGNVYAVGVRETGTLAGDETKVTSTVTTTTTADLQQVVTTDDEDRVTRTENLYVGDAVSFTEDADNLISSFDLPDSGDADLTDNADLTTAVTVETIDLETDDMGTTITTDDVATRTTITKAYSLTVTKAGVNAVAKVEDGAVATDDGGNVVIATEAMAPEGQLVITTTETVVTSQPGQANGLTLVLDATTATTIVASVVQGTPDESDPVDVTFATEDPSIDANDYSNTDGTRNDATAGVSVLATTGEVTATAGDTTWTLQATEIAVAVATTTTVPGEPTEVKGGVGLVSAGVEQEVDER